MEKKSKDGVDPHPNYTSNIIEHEIPTTPSSKVDLVYAGATADELYDPFSRRPATSQYSDFGAWAHLVKGGMGTGIMAMPMAFKYGGLVFGTVGTIVVGMICCHCVILLVGSAQRLYVRARRPAMTMDQVLHYAFACGPPAIRPWAATAGRFVKTALFVTYFFVAISYSLFIAEATQQLVEQWTSSTPLDSRLYIALLALVLVPISLPRHLKTLVPCSVLANIFILVGFSITMYYLVDMLPDPSTRNMGPTLIGAPIFFATALYSMEGIGTVMPVENTMRHPGRLGGWSGIASRATVFVVVLFTIIGFLGYLRFGDSTRGSVTLNLDQKLVPAQVVKGLLAAAITFTYPLQFYILCELVWPLLQARVHSPGLQSMAQVGMRVTLVCVALLVAVAVPNLELVISLVGAVLFSTIGLLIPAAAHLFTLLGEGRHGWVYTLTLIKDGVLIALSLLVAVVGVYSSLATTAVTPAVTEKATH